MAINNSGCNRAVTEYQQRLGGLKESAGLERNKDYMKLKLEGLKAAQAAGFGLQEV